MVYKEVNGLPNSEHRGAIYECWRRQFTDSKNVISVKVINKTMKNLKLKKDINFKYRFSSFQK